MKSKLKTTLLATSLLLASTFSQALELKVYSADSNSFSMNSTLVIGEKEAMVIDAGFTRADALRIVANVLDSGKTLTTILVSQADPDYYFGVETIKQFFPEAKVIATPAVLAEIQHTVKDKIAVWSPQMGVNAPQNVVLPEPFMGTELTLDGEKIEIRGTTGKFANRPYIWIPSLKTITGNVSVYGNMHLWTADSQSKEARQAWLDQLDEMVKLNPSKVIPGHSEEGATMDIADIRFNQGYLQKFESVLAESKTSDEVIQKMKQVYPNLAGEDNLEFSAKVNTGEMKW